MEKKDKKSTLLTPCRGVGLKRKSSTPTSPPFAPVDALEPRPKILKLRVANVSKDPAAATNSVTNVSKVPAAATNSVANVSHTFMKKSDAFKSQFPPLFEPDIAAATKSVANVSKEAAAANPFFNVSKVLAAAISSVANMCKDTTSANTSVACLSKVAAAADSVFNKSKYTAAATNSVANLSKDTTAATKYVVNVDKDATATINSVANVSENLMKTRNRSLGNALRKTPGGSNLKCKTQQSETMRFPMKIDDSNNNQDILDELKANVEDKKRQLSLIRASSTGEMSEAWKLKDLTETWRSGCQAALPDLLQHIRTTSISTEMQNLSMDSLLDHLNIPIELVHFDEAKHEFY